ncbi:hypothetical protein Cni_G15208 [Canna indica]|uniref:Uncharacterized protein n=1 Tax=Canna indica TaxID=4628 RepID=A0AAQ3KCZ3_9LILI|nr:hypothetical protein Cni_G15208 [Canna indica]
MGSKLHQINRLFTTFRKNKCDVVTVGLKTTDIRTVSNNLLLNAGILGGLNQLKVSMDGFPESQDKDSVRSTMLKHEEIFRHQVHELHRLYRVQKILMNEIGEKKVNLHFPSEGAAAMVDTRTRIWSSTASTSDTSHSSHVSNIHQSAPCSTRAGLISRELSICSRDQSNVQIKGFDLEQPAEEYTSKGERTTKDRLNPAMYGKQLKETSSEGPLSWNDDASEIELTLSIGCGPNKKKRTHSLHPNIDIGCSNPTPSDTRPLLSSRSVRQEKGEECGESSAGLDRENFESPPWLLQALNLNKT